LNLKKHQVPTTNQSKVQVSVKQFFIINFKALEEQWLQLEKSSKTSFFLSWKWIGSWLKIIGDDQKIYVVKAQKNNSIVGLGLFVEQNIVRHKCITSKQWYLHRTGIEDKDQVWIENNGFLISDSNRDGTQNAMWNYLLERKSDVDEYIINVAKKSSFEDLNITSKKYNKVFEQFEFGYKVSTIDISSLQDYLSQRSKNTRQQFNRSLKHLSLQGKVQFSIVKDASEQVSLLETAKYWHEEKWHNSPTPSGFSNKEFMAFHNSMISSEHPSANTFMAKLTLNNNVVGCLYCLTHEKKIYFYLSCLKPIPDNKIKLGLMMHIFMIEWIISSNVHYTEYDFLAGEARYKSSLTSIKDEYFQLTLQRNAIKFKVENKLRKTYKELIKHSYVAHSGTHKN